MIDTDPDRAFYGYEHVRVANEQSAVDTLLVTDELFRNSDLVTRKKYVALVESVRENGGTVYTFSSMHVSGTQLQQVSGVAAILRFPFPDLEALEAAAAQSDTDNDTDSEPDEESFADAHDRRVREDMQDMGM